MEQEIIQPVDRELIKSELTPEKQLRLTNKSNNEIYIVTAHNSPNIMREIGRLREIAFREAGGGTGKALDIDEFDTCDNCYKQLIVWNPEAEDILGGYRYQFGTEWEIMPNGQPHLATSHMFHFSEKFMKEYNLDYTTIITSVYRKPAANRFLAQFAPFLEHNIEEPAIHDIVMRSFTDFFKRNVASYPSYKELPCNFVGSIAYCERAVLKEAAEALGITIGTIIKDPMEGLVKYHSTEE